LAEAGGPGGAAAGWGVVKLVQHLSLFTAAMQQKGSTDVKNCSFSWVEGPKLTAVKLVQHLSLYTVYNSKAGRQ
jgi:hypothetical protein